MIVTQSVIWSRGLLVVMFNKSYGVYMVWGKGDELNGENDNP